MIPSAHRHLVFPFNVVTMAGKYIELMGLSPPNSQDCSVYDVHGLWQAIGKEKYSELLQVVVSRNGILFPRLIVDAQKRPFAKRVGYPIVILHHAWVSKEEIDERLNGLA